MRETFGVALIVIAILLFFLVISNKYYCFVGFLQCLFSDSFSEEVRQKISV